MSEKIPSVLVEIADRKRREVGFKISEHALHDAAVSYAEGHPSTRNFYGPYHWEDR